MSIREEWEDFTKDIPATAPPREIEIMRRGFYFGVHTVFYLLNEAGKYPQQERERMVHALYDEIAAHMDVIETAERLSGKD